jgi:small subunit ribosomal protein S2
MLHHALQAARDVAAGGGRNLFDGPKRQASDIIADAARRSAQYYVNHRWLGGTLTNWKTISNSIRRLRELDEQLKQGETGLTKKETLNLTRERDKLERALGGIKEMGGLPDMLFVIDTNKESIAVEEAQRLNIPVAAVVDSNSDPKGIKFPIPGNDDALRAIQTYCDLLAGAVIDGIQAEMVASGVDVGETEQPGEEAVAGEASEKSADAAPAADGAPAADKPARKPTLGKRPAPRKRKEKASAE